MFFDKEKFEIKLGKITPSEEKITKDDPTEMIEAIRKVLNLFMETTNNLRFILSLEEWVTYREWVEIRFGKWSHAFNKVLRSRIKQLDQDPTPGNMALVKKLNLVYLFWTKAKTFLFISTRADILLHGLEIERVVQEMVEIEGLIPNIKEEDYVIDE